MDKRRLRQMIDRKRVDNKEGVTTMRRMKMKNCRVRN